MRVIYHLFVNGIPKAQPRPRMVSNGHVYNPNTADVWKEEIKAAFLPYRKPPIVGPVHLRVSFFLPCPKSMKGMDKDIPVPHTKKPDLDNLLKSTKDAITEAGVWKDDSLVYKTEAGKYYTGKKTGAQIIVEA